MHKVIEDLTQIWLTGHNGVVAIYDDFREGEIVIVVVITDNCCVADIPTVCYDYQIVIEKGDNFTAEVKIGACINCGQKTD